MNIIKNNWRGGLGALFNVDPPPAEAESGFPVAADPGPSAGFRPAPHSVADAGPVETVLLVDDDADWCHECAFSLQTLGYEPIIALDPDTALELYLSHDVSIAIVDYNMPGQDGITLIQELSSRAEAHGRRLHFIMATGYATKDLAIDAMRASAVDFLEKPIRQADLQRALQRVNGLRDEPAARDALLDKMTVLGDELQRLSRLIKEPEPPREPAPLPQAAAQIHAAPSDGKVNQDELTGFIRELLKKEAKRREIGDGELFGDPTWEMLLDLLLAKIENRQVSVSSACIASGAPMSTALRLVRRLVSEGVLFRIPDEHDRRRHFLVMNPKFEQPLMSYLSEQIQNRAAGHNSFSAPFFPQTFSASAGLPPR